VEPEPLIGDIAVIVCNTGVKHELVDGEYNKLRQGCEGAATALGVKSLRSADPQMVEAGRSKMSQREYECGRHITTEIQRVVFGARALRAGDLRQFGQYMFQSHESSRLTFKNSVEELDTLVELARAQPGCIGARLTGGGFGGATINLVEGPQAQAFMQAVVAGYEKKYGKKIDPIVCKIVDGAH
jgi:galactokinase